MRYSNLLQNRDNWLLLLLLLPLAAVLPVYTWHEDTSGFLTDDAIYLMMADFFSPYFEGNVYVETLNVLRSRFPPAFPLLIALLGGGSQNMAVAHLVTGMTFLVAALFFYIWVRTTLGRPHMALACLLIFSLLPETLFYVLELRSEFLYLAFLFAAFVTVNAAERAQDQRHELLLAASVLVGLCILTRLIGVCLLAAFLIYLFSNRIPRKYLYVATAIALPACWYAIKAFNNYSNTYTGDLAGYLSYDGLWRFAVQDFPRNAWLMFTSWVSHFATGDNATWLNKVLAAMLLVPALAGFAHRIRQRQPDAFYVVFYIAVILAWPHPEHMVRFVYPLIPIGLLYLFAGVTVIAQNLKMAPSVSWQYSGVVLLILLLIAPNAASVAARFTAPIPAYIPEDYRHTRLWLKGGDPEQVRTGAEIRSNVVSLLKRTGHYLRENECIYADHRPLVMLYTQRPAMLLRPDLSRGNLERCKYLFVMNLIAVHKAKYPLQNMDHDRLKLLDIQHDSKGAQQAYLFRIRR